MKNGTEYPFYVYRLMLATVSKYDNIYNVLIKLQKQTSFKCLQLTVLEEIKSLYVDTNFLWKFRHALLILQLGSRK